MLGMRFYRKNLHLLQGRILVVTVKHAFKRIFTDLNHKRPKSPSLNRSVFSRLDFSKIPDEGLLLHRSPQAKKIWIPKSKLDPVLDSNSTPNSVSDEQALICP